jgi:hypothetical protein
MTLVLAFDRVPSHIDVRAFEESEP